MKCAQTLINVRKDPEEELFQIKYKITAMINNASNINKTNKYLSPTEYKKRLTYDVGNSGLEKKSPTCHMSLTTFIT